MREGRTLKVNRLRQWLMGRLPARESLRLRAYKAYVFGEPELRWALRDIKQGELAVDVGSNLGVYTYWLARRVGLKGRVIALDPVQECVQYLRTAISQLGLTQVTVLHCGASDAAGVLDLRIPIDGEHATLTRATFRQMPGPARVTKAEVRPLDDLLSDRDRPVSFVKCDTEGHELAVLHGTAGILTTDRPSLLIECEQRYLNHDMRDTIDYARSFGYRGWFLDAQGVPRPIEEFSPATHQLRYAEDPTSRNYINNFLFVHTTRSSAPFVHATRSSAPRG